VSSAQPIRNASWMELTENACATMNFSKMAPGPAASQVIWQLKIIFNTTSNLLKFKSDTPLAARVNWKINAWSRTAFANWKEQRNFATAQLTLLQTLTSRNA